MTNSILAFAAPVQAESIPAWIWLLLVAAGIVATVTDVRHTRIPNWLTLPLLAAGLLYGFMHAGLPGLGHAALGAVAAGLVMVIGYIMFGGGAGDAKIMMAFGAWLGFDASIILMLAVTITGFVQALVVIISRGGLRDIPISLFHSLVPSDMPPNRQCAANSWVRQKPLNQLKLPQFRPVAPARKDGFPTRPPSWLEPWWRGGTGRNMERSVEEPEAPIPPRGRDD